MSTFFDDPGGSGDDANTLPEFLRAAVAALPIGVLIVDADGAIVLTNHECERVFGYSSAELLGRSVDALVPDASRATHGDLRRGFVRHSQAPSIRDGRELLGRRKDGSEVPLEIGLTPIPFRGSLFVLASIIDITQRTAQRAVETPPDGHLEFDALVGELGAEFVNLRAEEVDRRVEDALGRVVRALGLDRAAIFRMDENEDFVNTHQWTRPGSALPLSRVPAREQFPWLLARVRANEVVTVATPYEVPGPDRENLRRLGTQSAVVVPLVIGGRLWGAVSFATVLETRSWAPAVVNRLRVVALIFAHSFARREADEAIRRALADATGLRDRLRDENAYLREEVQTLTAAPAIVGHSAPIRRVLEQVRRLASADSPVLLVGEMGTGKALLAARIHALSARSERPIVRINCAALSPASIGSHLFGNEPGPQAQGESRHVGRLELGNRSTIIFDEIAALPLDAQASLSGVLQDKQIHPLGGARPVTVDVRVIATTRRDLARGVAEGTFREDLYDLFGPAIIQVAPLRDRPEDIPLLVWRFVDEFSDAYGKPVDAIDKESMAALQRYPWPGNARELRNAIERAILLGKGRHLRIPPPGSTMTGTRRSETLAAVEKEHIAATLAACGGRISGRDGAAARLGLTPRALQDKMAKLGIRRPRD